MELKKNTICLICLMLFGQICGSPVRRSSSRSVVTVVPATDSDLDVLEKLLRDESSQVEFWNRPRNVGEKVSMVVDDNYLGDITSKLELRGTVTVKSLESVLNRLKGETVGKAAQGFSLEDYNSHDDMNKYLREKEGSCSLCTVRNIGKTYQGRDMLVLRVGDFNDEKSGVWIDAGIHAREWAAPATALFFIHTLTKGIEENDPEIMRLLDNYHFYILPSANPDGYEYSRSTDRLWRKTMSGYTNKTLGYECVGVDPNRNWDYHWNEVGASSEPCSDVYAGPEPFSEQETRNIAEYLCSFRQKFDVFITIHSYGQYWLTPWGYTSQYPNDYKDLREAADVAVKELESLYGTEYTVGTSTNVLYAAAGGSDDWAKGAAGIKYSYTLEVRDKQKGWGEEYYGFLLPPEQIRPTGEETWAGVRALLQQVSVIEARHRQHGH